MSTRDWDASTYDQISAPQQAWAREQLERLHLRGDETVLDAGCGSGKVTAMLVELVPDGRVYAVDVAPSMVEHTQQALGRARDRVLPGPHRADRCPNPSTRSSPTPPSTGSPITRSCSRRWRRRSSRAGSWSRSAAASATSTRSACSPTRSRGSGEFAPYFSDWKGPWNYARADITAERLSAAGFVEVDTWLEPRPTTLEDPEPFVRTVCLVRHLDLLPQELHQSFIRAVLARSGTPLVLDYVRLNMVARRAGEAR